MNNLIDENFDDFNFKPITDGLGFHNDEEKVIPKKSEIKETKKIQHALQSFISEEEDSIDMGALTPFYSDMPLEEKLSSNEKVEEEIIQEILYTEATSTKRFLAYTLDCICIFSLHLFTFAAAFSALDLNILEVFKDYDFYFITSPILITYYLFYFSFLDKTRFSTIGKRTFKIRLYEEKLTLNKTFLRALVTLLSVISLGLFSLLDFQSKLTDTKVINAIK